MHKAKNNELKGITKEMFQDYVDVQESGVTNMFDVRAVEGLSGLNKETIFKIMKNYDKLMKKYPDVRS